MSLTRLPRGSLVAHLAAVAALVWPSHVSGQEPPAEASVPCREEQCALVLEFDEIDVSVTNGRYGSPAMFEPQVLASLIDMGYRLTRAQSATGSTLTLLRPRLARAICDAVPGTNTPRCPVLSEVVVELTRPDQEPIRLTVRNRCSADSYMPADRFGQYAAQMMDFWLRDAEGSPPRPRGC